ncbi:DEAD/DEAH box helicase family protein [Ruminococcus sp.]|jgi:type III restriction enzyme|uniref:DEAD/DEAH box helicase family protein n=1 Tax=Ruminococcus sp. TaxID=41978 RepID=UPI0025E8598C|nr:DEAD/DEAH box helicase family protein [Ruminococcus sp.]
MPFLYEKLDILRENGYTATLPNYILENLNPGFELRPYQKDAFENFITHFEGKNCPKPTQVLFHMATGSGKTLIMAGLMLYLYKQGYRNFLFFVNLTNIVEKTKENFLNSTSTKYLFADEIVLDGERVRINQVDNFQYADHDAINICFTTTQGLHMDMRLAKENGMTFDDFDDKKVVLISDEAHHLNVDTRRMSQTEAENQHSWEQTVNYIFSKNAGNILLEFTATCDLSNVAIRSAYENKIVFDYQLKKFYQDKYSKDILTLRSDLSVMERAIQAIVLSQYRLKVFQEKRLSIKPVILFKAAKIEDSKTFMTAFLTAVSELTGAKLQRLKDFSGTDTRSENSIMQIAYAYFHQKGITLEMLAQELKDDFSEVHCVSVNDDKEADKKQILLNTLEDENNPYRAIFEVKKLDEGWDVLNLFDIVRLYETRQSGGKKISPATIAEAQLIGRGARYCPFRLNDEQPKYQRKYDDDITNEMRVCETLYYHCQNDHRYVTELHQALREIGFPDNTKTREYVLKDLFKQEDFYKEGLIFINNREETSRQEVKELPPKVKDKIYNYTTDTGTINVDRVMSEDEISSGNISSDIKPKEVTFMEMAAINYAIVNKALMKYPVYKFNTLKSYFPNLRSIREFITDAAYLGNIKIIIKCKNGAPTVKHMHDAAVYVLGLIAEEINKIEITYRGTEDFNAQPVHKVFRNKTVNYTEVHEGGLGYSQNHSTVNSDYRIDLSDKEWYVYEDNYGTSEEKAFVGYFQDYVDKLKEIYDKIYLIRNEREFHLYSFDDGERFEPDYVLFLQKKYADGYEQLQIFIEPKGTHLLETDAWKEKFLLQMKEKAVPVKVFVDDNKYKIWGLHFYNQEKRSKEFTEDFEKLLI